MALPAAILLGAINCGTETDDGASSADRGDSDGTCASDDDCDSREACVEWVCRVVCIDDTDCGTGEACDALTGLCEVDTSTGGECDGPEDCTTPGACELAVNPSCTDGTCVYAMQLEGATCDDGEPCTHSDECNEGACTGTAYDCDDDNPCTEDVCDGHGGCDRTVLDGEPCGMCATCDIDICEPLSGDTGPECDDPCTYCENGLCLQYTQGDMGECEPGSFCCGLPIACEGSSETCPGIQGAIELDNQQRFAELNLPPRTSYAY